MQFLEYPYVIITILVACFIVAGLVGIYFTIKSIRTARGTEEKSFCSIDKIANSFENAGNMRKNRCLIYASVSLDSAKRLYSESKALRILDYIKNVMLSHFCLEIDGDICIYEKNNFVAINDFDEQSIRVCIKKCYDEVSRILVNNDAMNIACLNFGYYCTSSNEVAFKTALERAKQACTIAENGDVLYCQWDSNRGKQLEKKIKIENSIKDEINNNSFFLEYQPIVDAKTNKPVGAEVLSRLNSPTDGILSPRSFLLAVNNLGLNKEFDYYIFEKNCKWISNNRDNRTRYVYTINFSRCTLCDEEFSKKIIEIINKYGLSYSCIAIEILEDKSLKEDEKRMLINNLTALKEKGILILLDDFGKGYTSFADLADFNIDIVKIDKSITQNATDEKGFVILSNIIRIAHDLGFKTLCEGIETEGHKKTVTDAGCDMLQGYYLFRPMTVTRLEALFEDN